MPPGTDQQPPIGATYARDGYHRVGELLDRTELSLLQSSIDRLIAHGDSPAIVLESSGKAVRAIHGCHREDEVCARLVRLPRLLAVATELLGENVYVYQFKVNFKAPLEGEPWPWHQDFAFWHFEDGMPAPAALNLAILLDDVDHDNGPLLVVPGSHRLGLLTPTGAGRRESRGWREHVSADLTYTVPDRLVAGLLTGDEPEPLIGPAGTVYAFHPSIVHSSARNTSNRRRSMLVITYNAVSNVPAHPNRPEFLVGRETDALSPLSFDSLRT